MDSSENRYFIPVKGYILRVHHTQLDAYAECQPLGVSVNIYCKLWKYKLTVKNIFYVCFCSLHYS